MVKAYFIQTLDIWNNLTFYGVFDNLETPSKLLSEDYGVEIVLNEYPGTWGAVFDQIVELSEDEYIEIRGYIFEGEEDKLVLEYT